MTQSPEYSEIRHQTLTSFADYETAIDDLIGKAARNLHIFDHSLNSHYGSVKRHDILRNFLLTNRSNRLSIAVHESENLGKNCPRLLSLLRQFSYAIEIRETQPEAKTAQDAIIIVDEIHFLHRFHYDYPRALLAYNDPRGARELFQRFQEIWDLSLPAAAATTSGL